MDVEYNRAKDSITLYGYEDVSKQVLPFKLNNKFYFYLLVFNDEPVARLLEHLDIPYKYKHLPIKLKSTNKSFNQAMFDDSKFTKQGILTEIKVYKYKYFEKLYRNFEVNYHKCDDFSFNPQNKNIVFQQTLHYSIKKFRNSKIKQFKLFTLINTLQKVESDGSYWKISLQDNQTMYSENFISKLPKVALDLETTCANEQSFPLGIFEDEKIISASLVYEYQNKRAYFMFIIVPHFELFDVDNSLNYLKNKMKTKHVIIYPFKTEEELLKSLFVFLYKNIGYNLYGIFNENMLQIITGYNILNFDIPYIYNRLKFYGFNEMAKKLNIKYGWKMNVLCDVYVLEKRFCQLVIGSNFKLDNVAKKFLNRQKVNLDIVATRRLYTHDISSSLNSNEDFILVDDLKLASLNYLMYYNIEDCCLVLDLLKVQDFLSLLYYQNLEFNISIYKILAMGNSKILASLMNLNLIDLQYWFSKPPSTINFPHSIKWPTEIKEFCDFVKNIDLECVDSSKLLMNVEVKKEYISHYIDDYVDYDGRYISITEDEKGFGGGANAAISGCYFNLASLDFTSLYPSIIINYKLDFNNVGIVNKDMLKIVPNSTIKTLIEKCFIFVYDQYLDFDTYLLKIDEINSMYTLINCFEDYEKLTESTRLLIICPNKDSILFSVIENLIQKRQKYKDDIKNNINVEMSKSQELLWKQISCCVFGCLGYKHFESNSLNTAASITHFARFLLTKTCKLLHERKLKVVYIDTDGVAFLFNGDQTDLAQLSTKITNQINEKYIHLKAESIYPAGIVYKKKKYIFFEDKNKIIFKGFMKNAITPIKCVIDKWFNFLFENIFKNKPENAIGWTVNLNSDDFLLAIYSELDALWKNALKKNDVESFVVEILVNSTSPVKKIKEFSEYCLNNNIGGEGARVPVFALRNQTHEVYEYAYNKALIDFKKYSCDVSTLFNNYWKYVIDFTICPKISNVNSSMIMSRFLSGERILFKDVSLSIVYH